MYLLAKGINTNTSYFTILFGIPFAQLSFIFSITPGAMGVLEGGWLGVLTMAEIPRDTIGKFLIGQRIYWLIFTLLLLLYGISNRIFDRKLFMRSPQR